jgi:DNA-binding protein WhiA
MSYSQQIKQELCTVKLHCKSCAKALLYGMLLFAKETGSPAVLLQTENKAAADLFTYELSAQTGAIVTILYPDLRERTKRPLYAVKVEDTDEVKRIFQLFFKSRRDRTDIDPAFLQRECCRAAFLRGVFLSCGTISDPQKEYHMEFVLPNPEIGGKLSAFLGEYALDFRQTTRKERDILYVKESNQIEDLLARMGAVKASFELMNLKIEKELRNNANRATNCETANIDKQVRAALLQLRSIESLQKNPGLAALPAGLREAAELRMAHPDASLNELVEYAGGSVSRSGLNHRLKRLCELAEESRIDMR